jgi:hypothetical protein
MKEEIIIKNMNSEFLTKDVLLLIKDYCEFEQLKLQTGNLHQEKDYNVHLSKLVLNVSRIFPSVEVVMLHSITVLFSEFLFSIKQVEFGSKQLEFKNDLFSGVDDLLSLLKIQQETPFNISKVSFQLRTGGSFINDNESGDSLSKKLQDGNLEPKTLSIRGSIIITALLRGIQSQRELLDEYSFNARQPIFNLDKQEEDAVQFAIKKKLKPLYKFLLDNNVLKSKNATMSKLVGVLSDVGLIVYDNSDLACQTKSFIKRLDRAFNS